MLQKICGNRGYPSLHLLMSHFGGDGGGEGLELLQRQAGCGGVMPQKADIAATKQTTNRAQVARYYDQSGRQKQTTVRIRPGLRGLMPLDTSPTRVSGGRLNCLGARECFFQKVRGVRCSVLPKSPKRGK